MGSREQAESTAAAWIARRERDDWTENEQSELNVWLEADIGNRVAWLRVHAAWEQTSRLKSLSTSASPGTVPPRDEIHVPFYGSPDGTESVPSLIAPGVPAGTSQASEFEQSAHRVRWPALAASLLIAALASGAWYLLASRDASYHTDIGALQAVALSDGSRITLNSGTQIKVDLTEGERRVNLAQGEAYFEVAKDPSRAFVVNAGDKRVIAVGTQFSVRREGDEVRVFVTAGKVRVEQGTDGASRRPMTELKAGSIARAGPDGVLVQEKPIAEVERLLSWRTGYLTFDRTPLADAIAEFNRYNRRKVVIEDPSVAGIRVGGNFRATNVDAFVRLIESDFPISAIQQGGQIILTGTPPPTK